MRSSSYPGLLGLVGVLASSTGCAVTRVVPLEAGLAAATREPPPIQRPLRVEAFRLVNHQTFGATALMEADWAHGSHSAPHRDAQLRASLARYSPPGPAGPGYVLRGYLEGRWRQTSGRSWWLAGVFLQSLTVYLIPMYFSATWEAQVVYALLDDERRVLAIRRHPLEVERWSPYALALGRGDLDKDVMDMVARLIAVDVSALEAGGAQ